MSRKPSKQVTKTCPRCGKSYTFYPSNYGGDKLFCSAACFQASTKVTTECPQCGKMFTWNKSWPRKYCSNVCNGKANASNLKEHLSPPNHYTGTCEVCGEEYTVRPTSDRGRFCSLRCYGKLLAVTRKGIPRPDLMHENPKLQRRVDKTCIICNKVFRVKQSSANRRLCCSKACYVQWQNGDGTPRGSASPFYKGGRVEYYGANWRPQRRATRKRDNYTCQHCGITEQEYGEELQVHHITPFRAFGIARYEEANRLDNLVSLCVTCHTTIGHHPELLQPSPRRSAGV